MCRSRGETAAVPCIRKMYQRTVLRNGGAGVTGLGRGAGATRSPVGAARTTGSEAPRLQGCTGRPGGVGGGVVLRRVTHGVPGLPVQPWLSRERAKYRNVTTEPTAGGWLRSSSDSPVPRKNRTPVAAGVGRPAGSDGKPRHCPARRGRWGGGVQCKPHGRATRPPGCRRGSCACRRLRAEPRRVWI